MQRQPHILSALLLAALLALLPACGAAAPEAASQPAQPAASAEASSAAQPTSSAAQPASSQAETPSSHSPAASAPAGESAPQAPAADPIQVTFAEPEKGSVEITLSRLPQTAAELQQLDAANFKKPQYAAALFVAAMCRYPDDPAAALEMIEYLNGPEDLSDYDKSYLKDRMADKGYKPYSYFAGASPDNDYTPSQPWKLTVSAISNTYDEKGYARFVMRSSGADSPRPITVRQKASTGEWFYWEQGLLADIRKPASQDAWK